MDSISRGPRRHLRSVVASALGWTPPPGQPGWTVGMDGWPDRGLNLAALDVCCYSRSYPAMLIQALHLEASKAYLHVAYTLLALTSGFLLEAETQNRSGPVVSFTTPWHSYRPAPCLWIRTPR